MIYSDGQRVEVGDIVCLGDQHTGVVVCCVSDGVYSENYTEAEWGFLKRGLVVLFSDFGPIHYDEAEDDLELISRAGAVF